MIEIKTVGNGYEITDDGVPTRYMSEGSRIFPKNYVTFSVTWDGNLTISDLKSTIVRGCPLGNAKVDGSVLLDISDAKTKLDAVVNGLSSGSGGGGWTPVLADSSTDGLQSSNNYVKQLYQNTVVSITEPGDPAGRGFFSTTGEYFATGEATNYVAFSLKTSTRATTFFLNDFENYALKSSYLWDGDVVEVQLNDASKYPITIKDKRGREIKDTNGASLLEYTLGVVNTAGQDNALVARFQWIDNNPDPNNRVLQPYWQIV